MYKLLHKERTEGLRGDEIIQVHYDFDGEVVSDGKEDGVDVPVVDGRTRLLRG